MTLEQLREHLLWGLTLSNFIDLRFRPAVQVTRKDVQDYYQDKILPSTTVAGKKPDLADMRAQIEQTLDGGTRRSTVGCVVERRKIARAHRIS